MQRINEINQFGLLGIPAQIAQRSGFRTNSARRRLREICDRRVPRYYAEHSEEHTDPGPAVLGPSHAHKSTAAARLGCPIILLTALGHCCYQSQTLSFRSMLQTALLRLLPIL